MFSSFKNIQKNVWCFPALNIQKFMFFSLKISKKWMFSCLKIFEMCCFSATLHNGYGDLKKSRKRPNHHWTTKENHNQKSKVRQRQTSKNGVWKKIFIGFPKNFLTLSLLKKLNFWKNFYKRLFQSPCSDKCYLLSCPNSTPTGKKHSKVVKLMMKNFIIFMTVSKTFFCDSY